MAADSMSLLEIDSNKKFFSSANRKFWEQYSNIKNKKRPGPGRIGESEARRRSTGELVFIRKLKLAEDLPCCMLREIAILKELEHENIIRFIDVSCAPDQLVQITEHVESSLKQYIVAQQRQLTPFTVQKFSRQLLAGVACCHGHRIIHRNLKPKNLRITHESETLKIADFSFAQAFTLPCPANEHNVFTNFWYRPPEILLGSELYGVPVDVWAVGCIVGELATGAPLFPGDSEIDTVFKIFNKLGTPTEEVWPGVSLLPYMKPTFPKWKHRGWANIRNTEEQLGESGTDLLQQLLCYDPRSRISARRALMHRYFRY